VCQEQVGFHPKIKPFTTSFLELDCFRKNLMQLPLSTAMSRAAVPSSEVFKKGLGTLDKGFLGD
jgi:hypothetical protein